MSGKLGETRNTEPLSERIAQRLPAFTRSSSQCHFGLGLLGAGLFGVVSLLCDPFMGWATLTYAILLVGLLYRKERKVHPVLMGVGIVMDWALVGVLELRRNAVAEALSFTLTPLQQAHIAVSSVATFLYVPIVILGLRLLLQRKGTIQARMNLRRWHLRLGFTAMAFRTLGLIFMFTLVGHHATAHAVGKVPAKMKSVLAQAG